MTLAIDFRPLTTAEGAAPRPPAPPAGLPEIVYLRYGALQDALDIIDLDAEAFQPAFRPWLIENWPIWERFCQEAEVIWSMGRPHYSARTIIEVMRHETALRQMEGLKIDNSFVPDCGRLYGRVYATRANFFECRELRSATKRSPIRRAGRGRDAGEADTSVLEVGALISRPSVADAAVSSY